jgi:hypothetical protein
MGNLPQITLKTVGYEDFSKINCIFAHRNELS